MTRFVTGKFAPLFIGMAAVASLGCGEDTSSESEYSGVVAALGEEVPDAEDVPPFEEPPEPIPVTLEEPVLPPEPQGLAERVGTHFEGTGSNVVLTSSEPIRLRLKSGPTMIAMDVLAADGSASTTQITLSGLEPTTTYYKYTDGHHNPEELVTDENGVCVYTQDLADSHFVIIQPTTSTIYLRPDGWSDPSVGTWDPTTLTGTLTQDVSDSIRIYAYGTAGGITLDGAGFTVRGSDTGVGIQSYYNANATIKNVTVEGFLVGISVSDENWTIENVNVQSSWAAVSAGGYAHGGTLADSTLSSNHDSYPVVELTSDNNLVSGNTVSGGGYGIYLSNNNGNTVSDNTVSASKSVISVVFATSDAASPNTISGNILHGGTNRSIFVRDSPNTSLIGNTISNTTGGDGIYVFGASHDAIVRANQVLNAPLVVTGYAPILRCVVDSNIVRGSLLDVRIAQYCGVTNNTLENSSLVLDRVRDSTVAENRQWGTSWVEGHGIYFTGYSKDTVLSGNTTSDNARAGVFLDRIFGEVDLIDNVSERNGEQGIIVSGNRNTLIGNVVAENGAAGLELVGGDYTTTTNTTALNNNYYGIYLRAAYRHTVSGSTVSGNSVGIYLRYFAWYNTVRDNRVTDNDYGLSLYYQADDNVVYNNTVCRSSAWGLNVGGYSDGNTIYNNDFSANRGQAFALYNRGVNYLSKYKPIGGNYWSHLGPPYYRDYDGDGFYDQAYVVRVSAGEMIDRYPLVSPLFEPCDNEGPITTDVTISPSVVEVNGSVLLTATVDDRDTGGSDIALVEYSLGDGPWTRLGGPYPSQAVGVGINLFAPSTAGVYEVCVRGTDTADNIGEPECTFLVAYDPDGGFVTGGGWIDSPEGAYVPDPLLVGKASFGFVSKYKKGASVPTGNTEFQFKVADLNFKSSSYEWLVIAGDTAKYKGIGTINGEGSYKFMLWGGDGTGTDGADTFRIRIWTEDEATAVETDIYDNGFDQALGGGSVVIHKAK